MNSFMAWVGGKKALRDEILARFPLDYTRYIEVFGGAGWVLFRKPPGYDFEVFNAIVDLLIKSPGYRAKKGNARAAKLGEPGCEENTVAGTVLLFLGKKPGQSGFDPGFILLATLEWAGIIINGRGEIVLTSQYISML